MKLWKRNAVVAAIVLFVCVAVYLNWSYQKEETNVGKTLGQAALVSSRTDDPLLPAASSAPGGEPTASAAPTTTASGYFASARLNRQQARDSALSLLEEAAANNEADQVMRDEANASIQVMASCTMAEAEIENLVTAKGFADCVAFVGEDSASVVVSVAEGTLNEADAAKIMEIAMERTSLPASQIKVIPAE